MLKVIVDKVEVVVFKMEVLFKLVFKNNVKIVFGIDLGVFKYGDNVKEFELLVKYGMIFKEVIKFVIVEVVKLLG